MSIIDEKGTVLPPTNLMISNGFGPRFTDCGTAIASSGYAGRLDREGVPRSPSLFGLGWDVVGNQPRPIVISVRTVFLA